MGYAIALWGEFTSFIGKESGVIHWLLYIAALILCLFMGRRERALLFWPSVLVLVFFFNPFFYKYIGLHFLSSVYWRLLWMLPISFAIACMFTKLLYRISKNAVRFLLLALVCACIFVTGEPVFSRTTYSERENPYEISSAAIDICEYIKGHLLSWKEIVIVPNELLCDIRQYSSAVCLLYGRNFGGFITEIGKDELAVYNEMSKEQPDVALITEIARDRYCRYIVFNLSFHEVPEDLTEYGYEKVEVIDEVYAIYGRIQ